MAARAGLQADPTQGAPAPALTWTPATAPLGPCPASAPTAAFTHQHPAIREDADHAHPQAPGRGSTFTSMPPWERWLRAWKG